MHVCRDGLPEDLDGEGRDGVLEERHSDQEWLVRFDPGRCFPIKEMYIRSLEVDEVGEFEKTRPHTKLRASRV